MNISERRKIIHSDYFSAKAELQKTFREQLKELHADCNHDFGEWRYHPVSIQRYKSCKTCGYNEIDRDSKPY